MRPLICLALLLSACAGPQAQNLVDPCTEAAPQTQGFRYGVAHVAGTYPLMTGDQSFLLEGAKRVAGFGVGTIKVYMTPNFREKYHETWSPDVDSLRSLAETKQYRALFAMPFDTFIITTYSFANGNDGGFTDGFNDVEAAAEYAEVRQLTEYLLTTYAGTNKRFVLQNWEGDWAARPNLAVLAPHMTRWINTRQQAVSDARVAVGTAGVSVLNAFEVNVVLDKATNVVDAVLPNLCVDAVSYSAWEAFIPSHSRMDTVDDAIARLEMATQRITAKMKKPSMLYLGELGFAETEMDDPDTRVDELLKAIEERAPSMGVEAAVYWQIFDNECQGSCRGFWLLRPDGALSSAGKAFMKLRR